MKSMGVKGDRSVQKRGQRQRLGRQPVAERPVAHLVVVLREDHEAPRLPVEGRARRGAAPVLAAVAAVVDERPLEGLRELGHLAEVGVVAVPLAGQQDVQRVVEVVGPLRVEAPARRPRPGGSSAGR